LEEKGFVSHVIIQGAKYFKATNPERLKEILEEKRTDIEATILEMDKIIPTLISKQRLNESEEEAEILVGIKGLSSIFNEETNWMKKTNTASYVIGATKGGLSGAKIEAFFKRMQDKRNYLKLRTKFIFNENMRGKFPYLERSNCCEIKYVNTGSEMTSISIFGNKVVIAVYSRRPFLFVIKSKYVAEDFKKYFEVLWKTAKE
jgi:hypothetical protein